jgi:hypothetical protein
MYTINSSEREKFSGKNFFEPNIKARQENGEI